MRSDIRRYWRRCDGATARAWGNYGSGLVYRNHYYV
jgi:hypothetical protein